MAALRGLRFTCCASERAGNNSRARDGFAADLLDHGVFFAKETGVWSGAGLFGLKFSTDCVG